MSHITKVDLVVRDLDALEVAAEKCGCKLVRNATEFKSWYTKYGQLQGDYPLPAGVTVEDVKKCKHKITCDKAGAYEVGVVENKKEGGYSLIWDFWAGGHGLMDYLGGQNAEKLKQEYAVALTEKEMQVAGFSKLKQVVTTDGSVVMEFMEGGW